MRLTAHYRLWKARTVPATALVVAFAGGIAVAVPATIWSGLGQREVVRVVRSGAPSQPTVLTPSLRQTLRDLERWARPGSENAQVEALIGAQAEATPALDAACGPAEVVEALGRQLAAQRTVAGAQLAVDPFATAAFAALAARPGAAAACLEGALARAEAADRLQLVRLLARLASSGGEAAMKAALAREATRSPVVGGEAAPVYALHGYLAVESDLAAVGDVVRRAMHAHPDPALQSALRAVATRKLSALIPAEGAIL